MKVIQVQVMMTSDKLAECPHRIKSTSMLDLLWALQRELSRMCYLIYRDCCLIIKSEGRNHANMNTKRHLEIDNFFYTVVAC